MRLITFSVKTIPSLYMVGIELQDTKEVVNLSEAFKRFDHFTMRTFLEMGEEGRKKAEAVIASKKFRIPSSAVTLKAPIMNPGKIVCIGMNYVDHCTEQNYPIPKEPVVFSKFTNCIASPGDKIPKSNTKKLDFEVELVIVIGKEGKNISKKDAMNYVAGYTVAHDVSARDWQLERNGGQWLIGKTMSGYAPIGPAIVTDMKNPHGAGIRCILNGKKVQDGNTDQLIFKTEDCVSWCSQFFALSPGDLIFTGTPPGVGCFRKPPLWLKNGDVVTCEIDGIGSITNEVCEVRSTL